MSNNLKVFIFITLFLNLKPLGAAISKRDFNVWRKSFHQDKIKYLDPTLGLLRWHILVKTEDFIAEDLQKLKNILDENQGSITLGCVQFFLGLGLLQRYLQSGMQTTFISDLSCKLSRLYNLNPLFLTGNPAICVLLEMCGCNYRQEDFLVNYENGTSVQKEAILDNLSALILEVGGDCHLRDWNLGDICLVKNLVLKFGFERISLLFQEKSLSVLLKQIISFLGPAFSTDTKEQILDWVDVNIILEIDNFKITTLSDTATFEIFVLLWDLGFKVEPPREEHFFNTGDYIYNHGGVVPMTEAEICLYEQCKRVDGDSAPPAKRCRKSGATSQLPGMRPCTRKEVTVTPSYVARRPAKLTDPATFLRERKVAQLPREVAATPSPVVVVAQLPREVAATPSPVVVVAQQPLGVL